MEKSRSFKELLNILEEHSLLKRQEEFSKHIDNGG